MAAVKINAEPDTAIYTAISQLLKDRRKVRSGKLSAEEWSARCDELLKQHGASLWN